jgi:hypothetical protein
MKIIKNSEDWRNFYKSAGAIATCESIDWLRDGCPKCGSKKWEVTGDCWAYCAGCSKGYPTSYPFAPQGELKELDFTPHLTP